MLKRPVLILLTVIVLVTMSASTVSARQAMPQNGPAGSSPRFHTDLSPAEQQSAIQAVNGSVEAWAAANIGTHPWVDPAQQRQTTAQWTILVHVAADNNLEGMGLADVNEMELSGSTPDVNVIVQIDRSADYEKADGDWTTTRRYYIQQDKDMNVINSTLLEDMGELDSGAPETIVDFATWGITNYPAQKYMFVMWDHGGAWIANSSDEELR